MEILIPSYANDTRIAPVFETYDSSDWSEHRKGVLKNFIAMAIALLDIETPTEARFRSMSKAEFIRWTVYLNCGVLPINFNIQEGTRWLVNHCKDSDETIAIRLLEDGMDPDMKLPGCWAARRYAKANREDMPMTWAWLERKRLREVANKQKHGRAEANARRAM